MDSWPRRRKAAGQEFQQEAVFESGTMKVYCEHGAYSSAIKALRNAGRLEIVHFPYDLDSRTRSTGLAAPSAAQICDLHLPIIELPGALEDYSASKYLGSIVAILGRAHRRDALHLDSAIKSRCNAFITRDTDILDKRVALETALPIRIFHPDADLNTINALAANVERGDPPLLTRMVRPYKFILIPFT